jgi:exodeoxyribonuclease VII large subunit
MLLDREHHGLEQQLARVRALSPAATLARGYAVVQRQDGAVLREAATVAAGERLAVRVADGRLDVEVVG